jgi:16S rRNA (cytosine1402-N4)-methyltransferase
MSYTHQPVLLAEVIDNLNIQPDGIYLDGTFGRGGHSRAILEHLSTQGRLIAFDQDPEAVAVGNELAATDPRFQIVHTPFVNLQQQIESLEFFGKLNGILLDLGMSSPQLDNSERGFSFLRAGPLDMRMNPQHGQSLQEWLTIAKETEIMNVLKEFGEERYAKRLARAIVQARAMQPLTTTVQLAEIIATAHPAWEKDKHPATRAFQAFRILINQELAQLTQVLPQILATLAGGGRIAIISFHSLEDRIVKRFFRDGARGDDFPLDLPVTVAQLQPRLKIIGKPIYPSELEIKHNIRSRSAVLRVAEKL